jgi:hypothetical protein
MSFPSLNIYLKMGRFLAITPPSTDTEAPSRCRQMHQVLMIVGLVMAPVGAMDYYRDHSSNYNFVKIAVCILAGWLRCAFSCRIIVEASKERNWRRLVEGLKETSYLVQDEEVQTRKVVFKFLGPQIIFWACTIYRNWFSVALVGVKYLKWFSVEIFETYLQFFYTLYICTLLEMIRKRYEGLRRRYEHRFFQNMSHLVQMSRFACSLNKPVDAFNDNFGYSLSLLICFTTLQILDGLDFNVQLEDYGNENLIHMIVTQVLCLLILFVSLAIVVVYLSIRVCYC